MHRRLWYTIYTAICFRVVCRCVGGCSMMGAAAYVHFAMGKIQTVFKNPNKARFLAGEFRII